MTMHPIFQDALRGFAPKSEPRFEIRETKMNTFDVFDLLPGEARWLATFQFFNDAKAFCDSQRSPQGSETPHD